MLSRSENGALAQPGEKKHAAEEELMSGLLQLRTPVCSFNGGPPASPSPARA